jgi:biopolymer transport protein ExbB
MEFIRLFQAGGPVMYLLLLCSIISVTIAVERFIYYKKNSSGKTFLNELELMLNEKEFVAAQKLCQADAGILATVAQSGIFAIINNVKDINSVIEGTGAIVVAKLKENLTHLDTIVTLAPLLGLLGTVIGMIVAFDQIESAGSMEPSLVAGGIKVALLTTVFGLIVAMILQVFYNYITAKIDSIVNDMEDASISLVDMLSDYFKEKLNK